ncbi:hypothetical protein PCASD_12202 [Puccinia coronata f. sp. avenae]|uniref:hAT-like transposase RNase-H fold domain-containing protein n=1 Tax=Puccinia coronata f. sp. avenae TaxID=200324 RepID=A0A2N5UIV3_9BASI|nr:hypothetical protein PCASD_12202 [Puccinia coronata f. sp. avenae]
MARTHSTRTSPLPQRNTSRPPSRQSSQIVTPVKTHGKYVRPDNDTRRLLVRGDQARNSKSQAAPSNTSPVRPTTKRRHQSSSSANFVASSQSKQKKSTTKKATLTRNDSDSGSEKDAAVQVMDLTQDSDIENAKAKAREDAILAGAKLPMTLKDIEAKKKKKQSGFMAKYLEKSTFDNQTLNQLLAIWLIQSALPWSRIDDLLLAISFNYARRGVKLFSCTWAAIEAHKLYVNLQEQVLSTLKTLKSKITLIHDVWTTKGNHHAFMGIAAAYVSDDWFLLQTLSPTQTTDSGSNNGTLTAEVDQLVAKKTSINLLLTRNHIRCFCHKVALILKAGLHYINIEKKGLTKEKKITLGFVPGLDTIGKDVEIKETGANQFDGDLDGDGDDIEMGNEESDSKSKVEAPLEIQKNRVSQILKKVNFVIQKITSSAARQSEFAVWSTKLKYNGPSLIAGYRIRWNVQWQSRDRA